MVDDLSRKPEVTSARAHANALGIVTLCGILREKGVLETGDLWKVRNAMVSIIEGSPMSASREVNRVREEFDAAFAEITKDGRP
jgi:hypothetical protein